MIPTPRARGSGGDIPRVLHKKLSLGQGSIWSYFFRRIKDAGSADSSVLLPVTSRRWSGGWELSLDEDHATSVRDLARAADQVRDYLGTIAPETDHSQVSVVIVPDREPATGESPL